MAANVDVEKQFLRLFMFSHKISLPVVRTFFVSNVLGKSNYKNDIITFLEQNKHELFHLLGDYKCCQCTNFPLLQSTLHSFRIVNTQFNKLYDVGISQPGHFSKGSRGRVFQKCLCCVTIRKDTNPKTYDISLLVTILYKCGQLSDNVRLWLDTIRKCRNRLCHMNDINEFSQSEIQTLWSNLECSVLMLAAEVTAQPDYKESIETQVDILKFADYSRDVVTPIMEAMKLEINNNINGIKQEQIVLYDAMKCLTSNVKELAHNCKEDNKKISEHVSASTMAVLSTQQDALNNLSDKVAQCHIKDAEHQKKVSETLEHTIQKLNFVVEIVNKSQSLGTDKSLQKNDTGENNRPTEKQNSGDDYGKTTSTTEEQKSDDDSVPYKLRWKIETPGHLEHKKDDIVKVLKKAIEIVKIGTSHKIEDIYEGSITIDTLLPMSILQNKEAFHHSIRTFLTAIVSICGIDTTIPLEVKIQITLIDQEEGSVRYSIDEMKHTTMINQAVQAVPTMIDRSIATMESDINKSSGNPECVEKAEDVLMLYGMQIKENTLLQSSKMQFADINFDSKKRSIIADFHEPNMLLIGCFKDVEWVESLLTVCESLTPICQIQNTKMSKKLLNTKTVKYIVYIASRSSQGSYNLKPLLECLSESKRLTNEIVTIRRDNVMPSDILIESKQISISDAEEEWISGLMDAIAMTGSMMYSLKLFKKSNFVPNIETMICGDPKWTYADDNDGFFVLLGSFKHVTLIGSILSKLSMDFKIQARQKSSAPLNNDNMRGIVCLLSNDLQLDYLLQQVILQSNHWLLNVVSVLMNQINLPKILLDTIQVDTTGNNEDWVPDFINAVQNMPSKAYILRFRDWLHKHRQRSPQYLEGTKTIYDEVILVMGNVNAIAWFDSVLLRYRQGPAVQLEAVPYKQLRRTTIKSIICIIEDSSNEDLSLHPNIKRFECWPNKVITVVRKNMAVPNLLKATKQYFQTGHGSNWFTDVMDEMSRLLSIVNIMRFTVGENKEAILLMGNTIDVQWFYSTLSKSKRIVHYDINLKQITLAKLCRKNTKIIICVVPEGSKEEDLFLYRTIQDFECWPNNVIRVVRQEMAVSNLFQGTKQIDCTGSQEEWLSIVIDSIHKAMSIVNVLRIINYNFDGDFRGDYHEDVLLMGNTIDVQWFCSALFKSEKDIHLNMKLKQIALEKGSRATAIQSIICVLPENSKEEDLLYQNIQDFECWPKNVITVVRNEITVPSMFQRTYQIDCSRSQEEWISKVIDLIHKTTSMVYICVYGPPRYSLPYQYNKIETETVENCLMLLKGNTAAVLWFYSTLEKSESTLGSSMKLMRIKSRNIGRTHINSVICIINKSTKEEEIFNKDLESFKNDVVTVVRDKVAVPNFLKETKQIEEDINDEKWILDVVDVIYRQMSLVYTLRFIDKRVIGIKRNRYRDVRSDLDAYAFIVLIGKTKDVRCFYSDLSKSENTLDSFMGLVVMPLGELHHAIIQGIICIVAESTKDEDLSLISKLQYQYEAETVTVVRDKMVVPSVLKDTKQIIDTGTGEKWLSDVVDLINRKMSIVFTLRFINKNVLKMEANRTRVLCSDLQDYKYIILMGKTKEVRCFYSDLFKSQNTLDSYMSFVLMPSGELDKSDIKGIICVVAESTKEEDFSLISKLQYQYEAETVTVVRDKMVVPSVLKDTKQIIDTGTGEKWLSDVVDLINRKMSMVYILRYTKDRYHSRQDDQYRWIWLIGNTNEIRWFYSALSKFYKIAHMELLHVPSKQLHTIRFQNIIFILAKTTMEYVLQQPLFEDLHFEPANAITVVRENTRVPNLLEKTKQINVTGNDDKWLSDVLDQLKSPETKDMYTSGFHNVDVRNWKPRMVTRKLFDRSNMNKGDRDDKSEDSGITSVDENY